MNKKIEVKYVAEFINTLQDFLTLQGYDCMPYLDKDNYNLMGIVVLEDKKGYIIGNSLSSQKLKKFLDDNMKKNEDKNINTKADC